ncbi:MAG TPA: amidohydrolase, partial [Streptosporangiaceae bacterium]|nr:amidohydrolase [Streptosporangiaceae bacterium]
MSATVPAVDVHAHVAVPAVEALIADEPGYAQQQRIDATTAGDASMTYNRTHFGQLIPRLTDLDVRLAAMDKAGVDMQAVTPVPQSHAWAGRALAERIVAVTNEAVAGFCAR